MTVALVLVSHSGMLADGLAELAQQMAADVQIVPAGGTDDGRIGTSFDRVDTAVQSLLDAQQEVILLTDLGSATMTVETVVDFHDEEPVRFVDAPFVEATVAAAVAAQQGGSLDDVCAAAKKAADSWTQSEQPSQSEQSGGTYRRTVIVADKTGLHARPAARLAEIANAAEEDVYINNANAESALLIMGLGVACGEEVTVSGAAVDQPTVDALADAIAAGLD